MRNQYHMNHSQVQGIQHPNDIKTQCKMYMNYHVIGQLTDGSQVQGIIENMDDESVTMLVPEDVDADSESRQGFGYFDGYDDYGRPRRRRYRRFRRRRYPYYYFVFPFIFPYPYYY